MQPLLGNQDRGDVLKFTCAIFLLQLAREVLDIAAMMVKPGMTTEEIDHAVHLVKLHKLFSLNTC